MSIEDLRKEALDKWFEYGEVIKEAFEFPKDSKILLEEPMITVLETDDEDLIRQKIQWIQERITALRKWLEEGRC